MFEREQRKVLKKFENEENDEAASNCRQDMCSMEKKGTLLTTYKHGNRKEVGAKASDAINATVF